MKSKLAKFAIGASIMLAMTFTLSCSSGDDDKDGSTSSSSGGSISSPSVGGNGDGSSSSATGGGGGSSSSVASGVGSSSSVTGGGGVSSSSVGDGDEYTGGSCDPSDYGTAEIDTQVWMAKNWGCYVAGSKCYNNDPDNCEIYGRLYNWITAMDLPSKCTSVLSTSDNDCAITTPNHRGICPVGWHIPSDADWNVLMKSVNSSCSDNSACASAGRKLKATSRWNGENGTNDYGFAALPGGQGNSNSDFLHIGDRGFWWSSSEENAWNAYYRSMSKDDGNVYRHGDYKGDSFGLVGTNMISVRCVKD